MRLFKTFSIAAALLLAGLVNAATVMKMSLGELARESDLVVIGEVESVFSYWEDNQIFTKALITNFEVIKGSAPNTIEIVALGGAALHPRLKFTVNMDVPGGVTFNKGEEILLFTERASNGSMQVIGLAQGKMLIRTNELTGKKEIPVGRKVLGNQKADSYNLSNLYSPLSVLDNHTERLQVQNIGLAELISKIQEHIQ